MSSAAETDLNQGCRHIKHVLISPAQSCVIFGGEAASQELDQGDEAAGSPHGSQSPEGRDRCLEDSPCSTDHRALRFHMALLTVKINSAEATFLVSSLVSNLVRNLVNNLVGNLS